MLSVIRAAMMAGVLIASGRRRTLLAPPAPPKVRRLSVFDAALALAPAEATAPALSLWTGTRTRQCVVFSVYGLKPVRFGGVLRLTPAASRARAPTSKLGVAALYDQLRAAGFAVADEAAAERFAEAPRRAVAVVRVLRPSPSRSRRAAWADDDARVAA